MLLGKRTQRVGDKRLITVDYSGWLGEHRAISSIVVTSSSATCTISGAAVQGTTKVLFFLVGGVLGESVTVSLAATLADTAIKHDTIQFVVVAP